MRDGIDLTVDGGDGTDVKKRKDFSLVILHLHKHL